MLERAKRIARLRQNRYVGGQTMKEALLSGSVGIASVVAFAAYLGQRPEVLLQAAGIDVASISTGDVPNVQRMRLWEQAVSMSGDCDFGLHMAEWINQCPEEHFDVLAYAVRSCATLGEHCRRVERYARLLHPDMFFKLEVEDQTARLVNGLVNGQRLPRHPAECMLALAVLQGRRAVGDDLSFIEVRFVHEAPISTQEHERIFRAPIRHGCARSELVMDARDLDKPQRHAEPRLQQVLERQLENLVLQLPEPRSFLTQVKKIVADRLPEAEPDVGYVAAKMHMSSRTLQRRLTDEGTSFAKLLAEVRRDMACEMLHNERTTIHEVAFALGFVEVPAFYRAFKRWTGKTPAEYRRGVQDEVTASFPVVARKS